MQLKHRADFRSLLFCALFVGFVTLSFSLDFSGGFLLSSLLMAVCCVLCFLVGTIAHNTMHHPIFVSNRLNRCFQVALSLCYGHAVSVYVSGHNFSHHQNTQTQRDVIRTSKVRFRLHLFNQLFFFFSVIPSLLRAEVQFQLRMRKALPEWNRQLLLEYGAVLISKVLLLWINWKCFIVYVLGPQLYCVWGIIGMNVIQHDGCDPNHPYNHTRNMVGRWVNWLTFNNGYHGAHHLEPGLHWTLYPEFYREKIAPHIHPSLEQPNLLVYLYKAYVNPGLRVTYDGRPFVPEPAGKDEDWIPAVEKVAQAGACLGAVS